jgi:ABC-type Mn2+/Zn2+ transport system ATPase subunit
MTEKESKNGKVKAELTVQLEYKDAVCDLTSLSGGEYDRCALALMLAVNEVSSSPFLILDESISSLDLTSSENVLDVLKDSEPTKIVLLVSHQANTGMFDHIVQL